MRCVFIFWFTIYLVEILSNVSLYVCVCVDIELVKALVQNECTRTLTQRYVNVCRDAHSQRNAKAFVLPIFQTHPERIGH